MYEFELIESEIDRGVDSVGLYSVEEALSLRALLRGAAVSSGSSFVECGNVLRSFGEIEGALECYGDAIRVEPGSLQAFVARGELFFELAVCGETEDARAHHGERAVSDFRVAMMLSLGSSDVVWRLGSALLVIGEGAAARGLAEKMLAGSNGLGEGGIVDFLYLLGFCRLFTSDATGALETFDELERLAGGAGVGMFGKLVVSLVDGKCEGMDENLGRLSAVDSDLYEAGMWLKESGCGAFLDVARALGGLRVGMSAGCEGN